MATAQYTALANITLGSTASSVTFGSIPNTYRDLYIIATVISSTADANHNMRFNSDSGNNYSVVQVYNNSNTPASYAFSGGVGGWASGAKGTGISVINIMDYAATDKHKTALSRGSMQGTADFVIMECTRWANTSAITTVSLISSTNNYPAGSTFALYGVK